MAVLAGSLASVAVSNVAFPEVAPLGAVVIIWSVPTTVRFPLSVASLVTVKVGAVTDPVKVGLSAFGLKVKHVSISVLLRTSAVFAGKYHAVCVAEPTGMPLTVPVKVVFPIPVKSPPMEASPAMLVGLDSALIFI